MEADPGNQLGDGTSIYFSAIQRMKPTTSPSKPHPDHR
jgi:hypothetical protein